MKEYYKNSTEDNNTILRLNKITKFFGKTEVLKDVSLEVQKGATLCLIGPSGSGKSTLLNCCNLLEIPDQGLLEFQGETMYRGGNPLKTYRDQIRALRKKTAMVFQDFGLFPHISALNNVTLPLIHVHGIKRSEAEEIANEALKQVGLSNFTHSRPPNLSGGQQQRVAIARALAINPDIIFFDEPTSALDPEMVGDILEIMESLANEGTTMIVVTHEINFMRRASSQIAVLKDGSIVESGSAEDIINNPSNPLTKSFLEDLEVIT